jgi:hypothetical protein
MLDAHLNALRENKCIGLRCRFRLIVENFADQAQVIGKTMLHKRSDLEVVCSYKTPLRYGCYTTVKTKTPYVFVFKDLLAFNAIWFHEHLVSANPFETRLSREQLARATREKYERQARRFKQIINAPESLQSEISVVFTGKVDQNKKRSTRARDDMMMATLVGFYYTKQLLSDPPLAFIRSRANILRV